VTTPTSPAVQPKPPAEDVRNMLQRARAGDYSTLPEVRAIMQVPANIDRMGGNLAREVEAAFLRLLTGKNLVTREALHRKLEVLRNELAGPKPTPIEGLLAARAIACWLQVHDADWRYTLCLENPLATTAQSEFHQRRMDRAHVRYLSALKTLAQVRKLAVPVLQVNIAQKQVNVGQMANPLQ
jgi:hypothetical protein